MTRVALLLIAAALLAAPPPEAASWTRNWSAWLAPGGSAAMDVMAQGRTPALRIRGGTVHTVAYWRSAATGIQPGQNYEFSVVYRAQGVTNEHHRVVAVLSWCADAEGRRPVQRDYAHREADGRGGFRLRRVLSAPPGSVSLRIELGLRGAGGGAVLFFEPRLEPASAPAPQRIRAAVAHGYPDPKVSAAERLAQLGVWIDEAGRAGADLIVLPEAIFDYGVAGPLEWRTLALAEPAAGFLSAKARQHRAYIVAGAREVEGGAVYNAALLYGRDGRLAGRYRKVHLPLSEMEAGITPGHEFPVFETDFGPLGLLVCWDLWFPEPARILRLRGARLIAAPGAGDVSPRHWDVMTRARALDNAIPLAAATAENGSSSRIVDANGEVLGETVGGQALAIAEVNLDGAQRLRWLSVGDALGDPASLYLQERRPDAYGALASDPARPLTIGKEPASAAKSAPSRGPRDGARQGASATRGVLPRQAPHTPGPRSGPPR